MLVRWLFADSEAAVLQCLRVIPDALFQSEIHFSVRHSRLVLFASANAGRYVPNEPADFLSIELAPGDYEIQTAIYHPGDEIFVVVHRFVRSK